MESNTYKKAFFKGLLVQLSNPKTIIILAGIFAAFLPSNIPAFTYLILFILVFHFNKLISYSIMSIHQLTVNLLRANLRDLMTANLRDLK